VGRYNAEGLPWIDSDRQKAVEKPRRGKVTKQTFPPRLEIPPKRGIPTSPQPRRRRVINSQTGQLTYYKNRTF
jgi:hypothetical protein